MITTGRSLARMGELNTSITVDPVVVNGQVTSESGSVIGGAKRPLIPSAWWPWIIAAAAAGVLWWMSQDQDEEEGDDDERPFDGG